MADDPGTSDLGRSRWSRYFQVYHVSLSEVILFSQFRVKIPGCTEQRATQIVRVFAGESAGGEEDTRLVLPARMLGIETLVQEFLNLDHGVFGIRQLHPAVASSTMRISSFVRPYNSYTKRSISRSVASI